MQDQRTENKSTCCVLSTNLPTTQCTSVTAR